MNGSYPFKQEKHLIIFFLSDNFFGITEHMYNMALSLSSLTEIVAVYDKEIEKTSEYLDKCKLTNIQLIEISALKDFIKLQANRRLIFHCHGFLHLKIASKLKKPNARIVISVHAYRNYWRFGKSLLTFYLFFKYRKSVNVWHFLCSKSRDEFLWFVKSYHNAFVFPLGVEDKFIDSNSNRTISYSMEEEKLNLKYKNKRLVYIADFNSVKRHKFLLRSLKSILENGAILYLIGDGRLLDETTKYTIRIGVRNNVVFMGRVGRDVVWDTLNRANVAVVSSRSETFGWCLLEAFCMNVPIVATDVGIANSLIRDFSNGFVVDVNCEEEEFCNKVEYALEHLQNVDNSPIKSIYKWQTFSATMKQCYDYIMNKC